MNITNVLVCMFDILYVIIYVWYACVIIYGTITTIHELKMEIKSNMDCQEFGFAETEILGWIAWWVYCDSKI